MNLRMNELLLSVNFEDFMKINIYKYAYECTYIIGTSKYYPAKMKSLVYLFKNFY